MADMIEMQGPRRSLGLGPDQGKADATDEQNAQKGTFVAGEVQLPHPYTRGESLSRNSYEDAE